ncbi:MAG: tetratricopeptide repeat protein [Betaproteobacteria bacterium]|nr:tetratricopeptide repeat protein [Betaproteobacteria bacterium]
MSTYDLEEQEQIAALKAWWKEYGNLVIAVVVGVALAVSGVLGWRSYQASQAGQASTIYSELRKAAGTRDVKKVRDLAGAILEQFPGSAYAPLAAFVSAKAHFESGDLKTARAQLEWVIEQARDPEYQSIARLRLANILIDDKDYGAALKVLEAKPEPSFEARFAETRGDIYAEQGKRSDARAAYKTALEKTRLRDAATRELLQLKLDMLGEGQ